MGKQVTGDDFGDDRPHSVIVLGNPGHQLIDNDLVIPFELTPKFDYDFEKAQLLNCPADGSSKKKSDSGLSGGMVALIVILAVAVAGLVAGVAFIVMKEKAGEPLFMDVTTKTPLQEKVAPYP